MLRADFHSIKTILVVCCSQVSNLRCNCWKRWKREMLKCRLRYGLHCFVKDWEPFPSLRFNLLIFYLSEWPDEPRYRSCLQISLLWNWRTLFLEYGFYFLNWFRSQGISVWKIDVYLSCRARISTLLFRSSYSDRFVKSVFDSVEWYQKNIKRVLVYYQPDIWIRIFITRWDIKFTG